MKRSAGLHHLTPEVQVFIFEGRKDGPTIILQAGIHGDEVAGVHALQEMVSEQPQLQRGRLIIIPIMNPNAYRSRSRKAPGGLDLNRCFPGDPKAAEPEKQLAHHFLQLAKDEEPMVVATLHESRELYSQNKTVAFGQTLVYGVEHCPALITELAGRLNQEKQDLLETWTPLFYPVTTACTEAIVAATQCVGICVETWMGFEESQRIRLHRRLIAHLLDSCGLAELKAAK